MNTFRLLAIFLVIPVIAFMASMGIERLSRSDEIVYLMSIMQIASIFAAALPILMIAMISLAGRISRDNRKFLLRTFAPGLHLTIYGLVLLIILNAVLLIAAISLFEYSLIGRIHTFLIGGIAVGALIGATAMISSSLNALKKAESTVTGKNLQKAGNPGIFEFVDKAAQKTGALPPDNIIAGLDLNFFVTEAVVNCLEERFSGRTLYLSLPLCRIMNKGEIESIIGHELAHYKGEDTFFSVRFYPIYRGASDAIDSLSNEELEGSHTLSLIPALYVLSYFLHSFAVAENTIGRERELAADMEGAAITDRETVASALVKVHAFSDLWGEVQESVFNSIKQGKNIENESTVFKELVDRHASPESLEGLADQQLAHPTDSHPPLSLRLESLGVDVGSIQSRALDLNPADAAIELIESHEAIEKELSQHQQKMFRQYVRIVSAQNPENEDLKIPDMAEDLEYVQHIEPDHEDLGPGDMLATAYYFQRQGDDNKWIAYLKHTFKKHPNTEQGMDALKVLMEMGESI